ncbi:MAG: hypothetical protein ACYC23_22500, partial [Limisphaerales bacterium]
MKRPDPAPRNPGGPFASSGGRWLPKPGNTRFHSVGGTTGSCATAAISDVVRSRAVGGLAALLMLAGASAAFAPRALESLPSAPFAMTSMADGFGGGTAAAGPYALQDTVGQPAEGAASSADYGSEEGFWYTVHDALQPGVAPAG